MKNSLLAPLILGGVVVVAVAAYAGTRADMNPWQDYAEVVSAIPAFDNQQTARQECNDEAVTQQVPIKDEKRIAGSAIGAVIGGVLGNQVGGGDGKKLATVGGAAGGAYAGNKIQEGMQERNTYQESRRVCETVRDSRQQQDGFDVTYRLNGREQVVHMDYNPGNRIPVENGALVITK
jgi:uncharacterized protein YcfJ